MVDLKNLRDKKGVSQQDVADYLEVSRQAYSNYELGKRQPDLEVLLKLAEFYDTTVDAILRPNTETPDGILSADELLIVQKIRALDEHGRKMVSMVLEEETRRLREKNGDVGQNKVIPLFGTAAAAGPGEPDTGLPWEDYTVPADSRADFAVRISGDSMEPVLRDGQIALCLKRRPQIGDIAVVMINGAMLVKQYISDYYGNVYLRSINRARKDCDYDLMASGTDTAQSFGVVILPKRIPLVEQ